MAVSKRLRYEILRRDNHACRYCGASAPDVPLTVDHVMPTSLGGSDDPSNLVTACRDCNSGKAASSPDAPIVADVAADALRWAAAMQYATERQVEELRQREDLTTMFDECWREWTCGDGEMVPRPDNWRDSVVRFVAAGLHMAVVLEALRTAMNAGHVRADRTWRYFCGICWRRIDELREDAAARIAAEGE